MPKRDRPDSRGQATRQRLVDAAIDIICAKGPTALTTGSIARGAGIQQSSFYAYFNNIEECLRTVAAALTEHMQRAQLELREANVVLMDGDERLPEGAERMRHALDIWLQDRRLAELMRRCRYDDSALGESAREAIHRSSAMLAEDLFELAVRSGISPRCLRDVQMFSTLITGTFVESVDLLIGGIVRDVETMAGVIARSHHYQVHAELNRMRREQQARSEP